MALAILRRGASPPEVRARSSTLAEQLRARDAERLRRYRELLDFYEGRHFVAERRGRTSLVVNYARAVVDKGVSYLFGRGIHISVPELSPLPPSPGQPLPPTPSPARGGGAFAGDGGLVRSLGDTPSPLGEGTEPLLHSPRVSGEDDRFPLTLREGADGSPTSRGCNWQPGTQLLGRLPLPAPGRGSGGEVALGHGGRGYPGGEVTPAEVERWVNRVAEECALDAVLLQAATNASVLGDAALKVVWDVAAQRPRVVNVDPFQLFPTWASDDPTVLREVALVGRLTRAEAQERFGAQVAIGGSPSSALSSQHSALVETVEVWTPSQLRLVVGGETVREGPNPYGCIPFVLVPNLQPPNSSWGVSDLLDVIPLNRELNERMSDQADVIRYHADPPVLFHGVDSHSDLPVGPGTVWDLPRDAEVSLLEWRGSSPSVQDHLDRVLRALYDVSETPRTSFGDSGRLLSGVALETELQPLLQRTLRKRVGWTAALRQCLQLVLRLAEQLDPALGPGALSTYRPQVVWPTMLPRDDDAEAQRNLALVQGGLRSHRTAMANLGELDPEAELGLVRAEEQFGGAS